MSLESQKERREEKQQQKKKIQEIMTENFPQMMKRINPQTPSLCLQLLYILSPNSANECRAPAILALMLPTFSSSYALFLEDSKHYSNYSYLL